MELLGTVVIIVFCTVLGIIALFFASVIWLRRRLDGTVAPIGHRGSDRRGSECSAWTTDSEDSSDRLPDTGGASKLLGMYRPSTARKHLTRRNTALGETQHESPVHDQVQLSRRVHGAQFYCRP